MLVAGKEEEGDGSFKKATTTAKSSTTVNYYNRCRGGVGVRGWRLEMRSGRTVTTLLVGTTWLLLKPLLASQRSPFSSTCFPGDPLRGRHLCEPLPPCLPPLSAFLSFLNLLWSHRPSILILSILPTQTTALLLCEGFGSSRRGVVLEEAFKGWWKVPESWLMLLAWHAGRPSVTTPAGSNGTVTWWRGVGNHRG